MEDLKNSTKESSISTDSWDSLQSVPYGGERKAANPSPLAMELPVSSQDWVCRAFLREIERTGKMENVKSFLEAAAEKDYRDFTSGEGLEQFCQDYADKLAKSLSVEDEEALREYSGYGYKYINQVARGQWNYELLGQQTLEKVEAAQKSIVQISHAISDAPAMNIDLMVHRGTNLDGFKSYNIYSVSELADFKNQFFLEAGFTSTSLRRDHSFAGRGNFDDPLRSDCNIAIEYLIPAGSRDIVGLFSNTTSYNPEQEEILIDKYSLSYVANVDIDEENNQAKLQMVLIPKEIYNT